MASGSGSSPLVETRGRHERFGQLLAKTVAGRTAPRRLQVKAVTKQRMRPRARASTTWRRQPSQAKEQGGAGAVTPAGVWVGGIQRKSGEEEEEGGRTPEALDSVELLASVFQDCFSPEVSIEEPCLAKSRNRKAAGQNRRNQGDVGRRGPRSGPGRWVRGGATGVEL